MPKYIVDGADLTSVANAIRTAGGTSENLSFPNGWSSAISAIGGGGGGATIEVVDVTNVLPSGKTLHHYFYHVYLDEEEGNSMQGFSDGPLEFPFVSGKPTYIQLENGESTVGDYMRASNISTTGDIEADGEYLTINGEGTVTITWVVA